MKPSVESVPRDESQSFTYRWFKPRSFPFDWHMHPELELTWIVSGWGTRYVGDSVEPFREGDLVLLGPSLPHTWASDGKVRGRCGSVVVQFLPERWGEDFLEVPELQRVRRMLVRSQAGLVFRGRRAAEVGLKMQRLDDESPMRRFTGFLEVLDALAGASQVRALASAPFSAAIPLVDRRRLDRVQELLHRHADQSVSLPEAAAVAGLSASAFSRFFRRCTGQTFVDYVHHHRIGRACRMLIESDARITEICYATGFGGLTNFNRVFRRIKGMTPRDYRQRFVSEQG